ncbi:FHA domain-containing protein [Bifidobacterium dolichotidis]|uniref:FHA domain-containing protein n=1 Tax=Bifidobacterium dolichotidis TaxID=2306976 RepID=A0A430FQW0_9BIFI|nr:FHA domain-containing protein [Bifidobacterium dolichotidis]
MITELTFAALKYGFLILLWVFVWLVVRSLHRDIETYSPRKSRAHRRKDRVARKAAQSPTRSARPMPSAAAPVYVADAAARQGRHAAASAASMASAAPAAAAAAIDAAGGSAGLAGLAQSVPAAEQAQVAAASAAASAAGFAPTLLVIIDGPLAGSSIPLNGSAVTLGRAASNTVVLDDEFVSSHHARVYPDPETGVWAVEDLHSTNGTVVNQQRISAPTILGPRVPVRIGATTFELR